MIEPDTRYQLASAIVAGVMLRVDWCDGHRSKFHPLWLRHQCHCDVCGTPVNALRGLCLNHLPDHLQPRLLKAMPDAIELDLSDDGHRSHYSAAWLRDNCYSDSERARRKHPPGLWDAGIRDNCPGADMVECEHSPATRLAMLESGQVASVVTCLTAS